MATILLFGGTDSFGIPDIVQNWVQQYNAQDNIRFIVGDKNGIDSSFHKLLSASGALSKSTIYCLDTIKNNRYEIDIQMFHIKYIEDKKTAQIYLKDETDVVEEIPDIEKETDIQYNRNWYSFIDKKLIEDCQMAICVWNGENKRVFHMIQMLGMRDKPCYSFTI